MRVSRLEREARLLATGSTRVGVTGWKNSRVPPHFAGDGGDIFVLSLEGDPKPRPLVKTSAYEGGPQFSPDGHWLAYASNETGQFQIYVRPFPGPDRKIQISTDAGSYPLWGRNGKSSFIETGTR